MTVTIANAAGFLGDNQLAPRRLVESATVDYLTLEYLAELTLSILAYQRKKDAQRGFASDLVHVVADLIEAIKAQSQLRVVSNGGGMNPTACARNIAQRLVEGGLGDLQIAVVEGDDLLDRLPSLQAAGATLANLDTGEPLRALEQPIISANAYLGASGIVNALEQHARIVITGRVADASLTVGPAKFEYGWSDTAWDCLAGTAIAGHIIECGAQATGGYSVDWQRHELTDVGYPLAEVESDGSAIITKPGETTGTVDRRTVVEQLVYEIGDPRHYLTPDVDVDFTSVSVNELSANRVALRGGRGKAPPDTLKVSLAYHDGYTASAQLLVYGRDCIKKARAAAKIIIDRVSRAGYPLQRTNVELLGAGGGVPGHDPHEDVNEVVLRLAVHDSDRDAVRVFSEQIAPMITSGPAGLAGYASGRVRVRPVYAFWPTLVPRDQVPSRVTVKSAQLWSRESS